MTYTPDYSLITEGFTYTWISGTKLIIPLILILLVMVFITRDVEKWKILALPVAILIRIMGVPTSILILIGAGIIFVIEVASTQVVGNIIGIIRRNIGIEKRTRKAEKYLSALSKEKKLLKLTKGMGYPQFKKLRLKKALGNEMSKYKRWQEEQSGRKE